MRYNIESREKFVCVERMREDGFSTSALKCKSLVSDWLKMIMEKITNTF